MQETSRRKSSSREISPFMLRHQITLSNLIITQSTSLKDNFAVPSSFFKYQSLKFFLIKSIFDVSN